ncbi:hypothetical protein [Pseudanabaena sp. FACHB-2040]|uniref:hypothetical protein n=1 Tax=Pseudanabaena sp. FACHB-2040 TaxID=2692859 RepID=UPI00168A07DE|nr:hypothetical protein [Pseudanabaena sp. FACHB-2040]MBD2260239.1 hypothetical protein [Pseudanabaena sp. FACHB-2040]
MIHQPIHTPNPTGSRRSPYQYSIARRLQDLLAQTILGGLLLAGLSSCTAPASSGQSEQAPPTATAQADPEADPETGPETAIAFDSAPLPADPLLEALQQMQAQIYWLAPRTDPITVTLYRLDARCEDFISEPLEVSRESPIQDTVGRVLAAQNFFAFDLAGYRVAVDPFGTANVDLRLHPKSERLLTSLSICEQMALFGSLSLTLQENPDWNIEQVTFTERGNPLIF